MTTTIKGYFVRITYHDDTPTETTDYDDDEEASESYHAAVRMRENVGAWQFGDCCEIMWGAILADDYLRVYSRTSFD